MRYRPVNTYLIKFWYPTPYTWNKNGLQESWIKIRAYNVGRAIITAKKSHHNLIVKEVTFI